MPYKKEKHRKIIGITSWLPGNVLEFAYGIIGYANHELSFCRFDSK